MSVSQLDTLEAAGLILLDASTRDLEYSFRHTLVQEAAYQSLTRQNRRQLHSEVGLALERLFPDRVDELAAVLANHFSQAGDTQRAFRYHFFAGKHAQRVYANSEAAMHYEEALQAARSQPDVCAVDNVRIEELFLSLGRVLELSGRFPSAIDTYKAMGEYARNCGNQSMELASMIARTTILSTPTVVYNPDEAMQLSDQAMVLAKQLGDRAAESKIYWNLMLLNSFTNHQEESRQAGEAALTLAKTVDIPQQTATILGDYASFVFIPAGELENAVEMLQQAEALWRQIDNLPMLNNTLSNISRVKLLQGDYQSSLEYSRKSYQLADSIGNIWGKSYSKGMEGSAYADIGETKLALAALEEGFRLGVETGFMAIQPISLSLESFLYTNLGAFDLGLEKAREAVKRAEESFIFWLPQTLASLGLALLYKGEGETAEVTFHRLEDFRDVSAEFLHSQIIPNAKIEWFCYQNRHAEMLEYAINYLKFIQQHAANIHLPNGLYQLGRAHLALRHPIEARQYLEQAYSQGVAQNLLQIQWQAALVLANLPVESFQPGEQVDWAAIARKHAKKFAIQIGDPKLAKTFLHMVEAKLMSRGE